MLLASSYFYSGSLAESSVHSLQFQVIVMDANMGCGSCRDRVFQVLSRMTGEFCQTRLRFEHCNIITPDINHLDLGTHK